MILSHHLLDPFRTGGKAKDRCDFFLQFESEIVLSSSTEEMELVSNRPEELKALIEHPGMVRERGWNPSDRSCISP